MADTPPTLRLEPHPTTKAVGVDEVSCAVRRRAADLTVDFWVAGPATLLLPEPHPPARADDLWRTTCFEIFLRRGEGEGYIELNFSPSGLWAAYSFDAYRRGAANLDMAPPLIRSERDANDRFHLSASFGGDPFSDVRWLAGVSAVIEETDGTKSYWGLAHPSAKPDFHHPDSFVLELR